MGFFLWSRTWAQPERWLVILTVCIPLGTNGPISSHQSLLELTGRYYKWLPLHGTSQKPAYLLLGLWKLVQQEGCFLVSNNLISPHSMTSVSHCFNNRVFPPSSGGRPIPKTVTLIVFEISRTHLTNIWSCRNCHWYWVSYLGAYITLSMLWICLSAID